MAGKRRGHKQTERGRAPYGFRRRKNIDPFDAVLDARSEALYEDDPLDEPDTREVAEQAWMPLEAPVSPPEGRIGRG